MIKNYLIIALRNLFRNKWYVVVYILGICIATANCIVAQENQEFVKPAPPGVSPKILPPPAPMVEDMSVLSLDYQLIQANQNPGFCLPSFPLLYNRAIQVSELNKNLASSVLKSKNNFVEIFHNGFRVLGATAGGYGPPLSTQRNNQKIDFKQKDLDEKKSYLKLHLSLIFKNNYEQEWLKLDKGFRNTVLDLLYVIHESGQIINHFTQPIQSKLAQVYPDFENQYLEILMGPWVGSEENIYGVLDVIEQADLSKLSYASRILNEGIQAFIRQQSMTINPNFDHCLIESKWGNIGIYGLKDDQINDEFSLLINLGGNDTYRANSVATNVFSKPISCLIDLNGDDIYLGENASVASGVLGIGCLFDLQGDDSYYSDKSGLAFSLFGSSILFDGEGNDHYKSLAGYSQAAAIVGVSHLCDMYGNDVYESKSYSQAFAGTMGSGFLIDFAGDDIYTGIESENHQNSFVQGASKGRWAEAGDGQNLAGGVGMLMDFSGNDQYNASSFSQAASYYFGLGLLYDHSGVDQYNSITHSQGYAAHYSLSAFIENQGDDSYNKSINVNQLSQIIGGGRDFSCGWFKDVQGNDEYHFGNRSAGIGDMNGIGVLWDGQGDDTYHHHRNRIYSGSPSLGKSILNNSQMRIDFRLFGSKNPPNNGIFIDSAGTNEIKKHEY